MVIVRTRFDVLPNVLLKLLCRIFITPVLNGVDDHLFHFLRRHLEEVLGIVVVEVVFDLVGGQAFHAIQLRNFSPCSPELARVCLVTLRRLGVGTCVSESLHVRRKCALLALTQRGPGLILLLRPALVTGIVDSAETVEIKIIIVIEIAKHHKRCGETNRNSSQTREACKEY